MMTTGDEFDGDEGRDEGFREAAERLERAEGVLIEPGSGRLVGSDPTGDAYAPDDYSADPYSNSHPGPGTVDDLPLDYGQELIAPADQHLIPDHSPLRRGVTRECEDVRDDSGRSDQDELWSAQRALVEEDERTGLKLAGLDDDRAEAVLDAMGDDVAESLPDAPEGKSATGSETA